MAGIPAETDTDRGVMRRWTRLARHAALGALFGYAVLHPVAMMIFRRLDHAWASGAPNLSLAAAALEAFSSHMLAMGLLFALLGATVGAVDGWLRQAVLEQRTELSRMVRRLEHEQRETLRLHEMHRRSMRFLAHDLKTHIGCILGFAQLLRSSPVAGTDPEAADAAARIERQATKLKDGVTDLLELTRLEEGVRPATEPVAAGQLLEDVLDTFALRVNEGRLLVPIPDPGLEPLMVSGDRRLLIRVLYNLVANALTHGTGHTRVKLAALPDPDDPAWVVFTCADSGPGIPAEVFPFIFEEFRSGTGSSGLGLAFCRAAVEGMGGTIRCGSSPGEGSTFVVRLPRAEPTKEVSHERKRNTACGTGGR